MSAKLIILIICQIVWWVIAICALIKFNELVKILRNGFVVKVDEKVRMTGQLLEDEDERE